MTKYTLLFLLIIAIGVVSIFGGYIGYTTNGVPQGGGIGTDTIGFIWDMTTFSVDGMPGAINAIFILFEIGALALGVWTLRGNA